MSLDILYKIQLSDINVTDEFESKVSSGEIDIDNEDNVTLSLGTINDMDETTDDNSVLDIALSNLALESNAIEYLPSDMNFTTLIIYSESKNGLKVLLSSPSFDWDSYWMSQTIQLSRMSKCAAKRVACVITNDNSIVATGINGSFPGSTNCNDIFQKIAGEWYSKDSSGFFNKCKDPESHHKWSNTHEVHAEINAIGNLSEVTSMNNLDMSKVKMFVTHSPCEHCAKHIIKSGIKHVIYYKEYDNAQNSINVMTANGITVERLQSQESQEIQSKDFSNDTLNVIDFSDF